MSLTVNKNNSYNINNTKPSCALKTAAAAGSVLGLAASGICIARMRGLKVPSSFKTKEYIDIFKKIEFNEKDVITLASSLIAGGFAGGVLTDKKNGFITGVLTGNKVSQYINKHLFNENSYRNLNWKDWAVQMDNVCLVTSMSAPSTNIAKTASRIIPFAHIIPGYCVGTKK